MTYAQNVTVTTEVMTVVRRLVWSEGHGASVVMLLPELVGVGSWTITVEKVLTPVMFNKG